MVSMLGAYSTVLSDFVVLATYAFVSGAEVFEGSSTWVTEVFVVDWNDAFLFTIAQLMNLGSCIRLLAVVTPSEVLLRCTHVHLFTSVEDVFKGVFDADDSISFFAREFCTLTLASTCYVRSLA